MRVCLAQNGVTHYTEFLPGFSTRERTVAGGQQSVSRPGPHYPNETTSTNLIICYFGHTAVIEKQFQCTALDYNVGKDHCQTVIML
jgi:hypothetical protein